MIAFHIAVSPLALEVIAERFALWQADRARYLKATPARRLPELQDPSNCGDCEAAREDGGTLCSTHAGVCESCGAAENLHAGDVSRTKVHRGGTRIVELWCSGADCDPPTQRNPAQVDPWDLSQEELASSAHVQPTGAEEYSERLRMSQGAVGNGPRGAEGEVDWQDPGLRPWTETTDFGGKR